jgi:hypothetical protein
VDAPKKRKVVAPKPKTTEIEEETPSTPSAADVEEISNFILNIVQSMMQNICTL